MTLRLLDAKKNRKRDSLGVKKISNFRLDQCPSAMIVIIIMCQIQVKRTKTFHLFVIAQWWQDSEVSESNVCCSNDISAVELSDARKVDKNNANNNSLFNTNNILIRS